MKNTGIIRRIDDLGRVVILKEIRNNLHIKENDPLELYIHENMVCFKKFSPMTNNQNAINIAMEMAEQGGLNIAIYDTDKLIAGEGNYPTFVSDDWRIDSLLMFCGNFYDALYDFFVFPVTYDGKRFGYVVASRKHTRNEKIGCGEMIANYLSIALEKD